MTDDELYARGAATLVASWEAYARGTVDASAVRAAGVAAAVFPTGPKRAVFNNALFDRDLDGAGRASAIAAMEHAYGAVEFAAWVRERDAGLVADLVARGYRCAESTRAMGMRLDEVTVPRPMLSLSSADAVAILGVPDGLFDGVDLDAFHVTVAEDAAVAMAYDHDGDCGIYNVTTLPAARRRGLGTALSALQLHDARARGCTTASIQSTAMAEAVYRAVGFRDLGRFLEFVPAAPRR